MSAPPLYPTLLSENIELSGAHSRGTECEFGNGDWYVGGNFTVFDGVTRNSLAEVDGSGNVLSWNPAIADQTNSVAFDPGNSSSGVFCGGFNQNQVIYLGIGRISGTTHRATTMEMEVDVATVSAFAFRNVGGTSKRLAVGPNAHFLDPNLAGRNNFAEWNNGGNLTNSHVLPNVNGTFGGLALNGTVEAGALHTVSIGEKELVPGVYLLRLTCGDTQIVERITILR